jgi:transposase
MDCNANSLLFPITDATPDQSASARPRAAAPRFNRPERLQAEFRAESLDQRLDRDHTARVIWAIVEGLDLSSLYERIAAVEGEAGRNASDPRVLFALWLYACVDGVGSARKLEKLCNEHRAYEWLRGGVPVNYHLLSDFRVDHQELLEQLLTQTLAGLLHEGLIHLQSAAQDGMRVRASAGTRSFKRQPTLEESLKEARAHVEKVRADNEGDGARASRREKQARERAVRDKAERIAKALGHVQEIATQREARKKGDGAAARASTTDPEARNMKMPDGGFRPGYNAQFATETGTGIIVGVDVTNQGSDAGQMKPMVEQIRERLEQVPETLTADGGFSTIDDIEATAAAGTEVYTPVKEAKRLLEEGKNPYTPKPGDSPAIADWRVRMGSDLAKAIYQLRAQTAELTNANMRNHGLYRVNVRGLSKVKTVLLWHVLAHNLLRAVVLRSERATAAPAQRIT